MKKPIVLAISASLTLLAACNQQSSDVEPNEAGSRTLPEYYSKPTNKTPDRTLACMLRELSLQASNNSFDHSSNGSTWSIKVIYGRNGIVSGGQIGEIIGNSADISFYYKPALGNFGFDAWNVETVIPKTIDRCA